MKKISFLISVFLSFSLPAWPAVQTYHLDEVKSQVKFTGYSTGHDFWGLAKQMNGRIRLDFSTNHLEQGDIHIPIAGMETGNVSRDHAMQHMFDYPEFEEIVLEVKKITPQNSEDRFLLEGDLIIHSVRKPLKIQLDRVTGDASFESSGTVSVSLSDFGLKAPAIFGVFKVKDKVDIEFKSKWVKDA